jgi:excisionase family DNA binding protein
MEGPMTTTTTRLSMDAPSLPYLLTVVEVAELLRTTRKAVYSRVERGLLPGVIRDGRRVLLLRDDVLQWIGERRAASPGSAGR